MFQVDSGRVNRSSRALVVSVTLGRGAAAHAAQDALDEMIELARSAGYEIRGSFSARRERPDPAHYLGGGKVEELAAQLKMADAGVALFDVALSPAQQRNLERELEVPVLDRTALILDIFAQRAKSREGKLQVELAQLEHLSTRLVRGWTHLERQRGGLGKTGGPGEKQIELDRRMIASRVKLLRERLKTLHKQRRTQRRARARRDVFSVSLVGYTNAGKSTLFNALTKAGAYAADKLFATLDTTSRRLYLDGAGQVVLSDTVGFIRDLPHSLVAAFHATLEETASADLLLHVIDSASADRDAQIAAVNSVLEEIGAAAVPQILVWNKIDVTGVESGIERDAYGKLSRVRVSAKTGAGLDLLRLALAETAQGEYAKPVSPAVDAA